MHIRPVRDADIARITEIYNWYILNTVITFELEPLSAAVMGQRIQEKVVQYDWLVGDVDGTVMGYAYYGAFHPRAAYHHTVETSIYLDQEYRGKGWGTDLYRELLDAAAKQGFREVMSLIALPNAGSIGLHRKLGFQEVGVMQNVGYKLQRYVDVALWQKTLEPPEPRFLSPNVTAKINTNEKPGFLAPNGISTIDTPEKPGF
jgi:phosphinothricin acetyltransferase